MMECATVSCDIDECALLLRSSTPKARSPHRCHECKRIIIPGETYLVEVVKFDVTVETWKTCTDCQSIRANFFKDGWFYGETKIMLKEHIWEFFGDVSESCIASLTTGARNMVCDLIQERFDYDNDDSEVS